VRYNSAIERFSLAFKLIKEELTMFSLVSFILIYLSAVGIYYFENTVQPEAFSSIFSSLWWSVVTLTTVGYGDVIPVTIGGRIFTFIILMIGLGIIAIPSGMISSALTEARDMEKAERKKSDDK
jgi:voltage-gated potassium channel